MILLTLQGAIVLFIALTPSGVCKLFMQLDNKALVVCFILSDILSTCLTSLPPFTVTFTPRGNLRTQIDLTIDKTDREESKRCR